MRKTGMEHGEAIAPAFTALSADLVSSLAKTSEDLPSVRKKLTAMEMEHGILPRDRQVP